MKKVISNGRPTYRRTGVNFGGDEVYLFTKSPSKVSKFRQMCVRNAYRASCTNVEDVMSVAMVLRDRMVKGKPIWN